MTKTEMAELTRTANACLEKSTTGSAYQSLDTALRIFEYILRFQQTQDPPVKAKELCHTYNKLRSTSQRLSRLNFDATQGMDHVVRAAEYGDYAIEFAKKSRHESRVAQMRFYRACVGAEEIRLRTADQRFEDPTELERRNAEEAVTEAFVTLQSIHGLEVGLYKPMMEQSLEQLRVCS